MKKLHLLFACALALSSCKPSAHIETQVTNIAVANQFIDAFYSFNRDTLQTLLSTAAQSQPEILYYQKWAECAHYQVLDRIHYFEPNDTTVVLPVTVKDDLMSALAINFNVTDTFRLTIKNGKILSVKTSSNDPPEYYQAKEWVKQNRPELIEKPCEGIWADGPTPCECVLGMLKGFVELTEEKRNR